MLDPSDRLPSRWPSPIHRNSWPSTFDHNLSLIDIVMSLLPLTTEH
jgi:hypothetical protein